VIAGLCWREGKEAFEKARAGRFACVYGGSCETDARTGKREDAEKEAENRE